MAKTTENKETKETTNTAAGKGDKKAATSKKTVKSAKEEAASAETGETTQVAAKPRKKTTKSKPEDKTAAPKVKAADTAESVDPPKTGAKIVKKGDGKSPETVTSAPAPKSSPVVMAVEEKPAKPAKPAADERVEDWKDLVKDAKAELENRSLSAEGSEEKDENKAIVEALHEKYKHHQKPTLYKAVKVARSYLAKDAEHKAEFQLAVKTVEAFAQGRKISATAKPNDVADFIMDQEKPEVSRGKLTKATADMMEQVANDAAMTYFTENPADILRHPNAIAELILAKQLFTNEHFVRNQVYEYIKAYGKDFRETGETRKEVVFDHIMHLVGQILKDDPRKPTQKIIAMIHKTRPYLPESMIKAATSQSREYDNTAAPSAPGGQKTKNPGSAARRKYQNKDAWIAAGSPRKSKAANAGKGKGDGKKKK